MTHLADAASNVTTTLIDSLIASNRGDQHAFSFNDKRYSYQDVAALMNRAGNMVKRLPVEKGAFVVLLLPPSPALVASLLGVIKAGAVPVLGAPRDDAAALERCIAVVRPAAVIVHQDHLSGAGDGLGAVPDDAVVVVGTAPHGYKSFVQEVREQPSWLAPEEVSGDAPALGIWTGAALDTASHAELAAFIEAGDVANAFCDASAEGTMVAAILLAFSRGEEATLS